LRWLPAAPLGYVAVVPDGSPKSLVFSLHDSLLLLAPRGWKEVQLTFVESRGQLRLAELETKGEGSNEPKPRAPFFIEPDAEARHLSEALTELKGQLGGRWQGTQVRVERQGRDFEDWKLLAPDGGVAWFTRLTAAELDGLLVTEALLDLVTGTSRAFEALQAQLTQRLGRVTSFAFDAQALTLRLERAQGLGPVELPAQLVGAYLSERFTWVWSWSDEEAPAAGVERVRRVCSPEAQPQGLSALWRPSYHCDEGFAWTVAGSVAVSAAARGLFRGTLSDGSGAALFAVMELP